MQFVYFKIHEALFSIDIWPSAHQRNMSNQIIHIYIILSICDDSEIDFSF